MPRFDQSKDVFRWRSGLDVVARTGNVTATRSEGFQTGNDFPSHVIRRPVRQDVLIFHAAMEDRIFPEVPVERRAKCDELGVQIYNPMEDDKVIQQVCEK